MMGISGIVVLCFVAASVTVCNGFAHGLRPSQNFKQDEVECYGNASDYRPYPYDCKKYLGCENRAWQVFVCPGELYWNDAVKSCDLLERTDCSNIVPFPDPDCSDGANTYYTYPYDCSKFYECLEKQLYVLTCPESYLWNDKIKKCDDSPKVDCSGIIPFPGSSTAGPTAPTGPTSGPYTTPQMICHYDHEYYPDYYDCSKYYECANGHVYSMSCPPGELWHQSISTCDWPEHVDCSYTYPTGGPSPTTTKSSTSTPTPTTPSPTTTSTVPSTTTTPTTIPPVTTTPVIYTTPKIECTYENQYFPDVRDCSKYYECTNGKAQLMDCPPGELWNNELATCDWPTNVDCSYTIPPL